jgi:hypothetical protein
VIKRALQRAATSQTNGNHRDYVPIKNQGDLRRRARIVRKTNENKREIAAYCMIKALYMAFSSHKPLNKPVPASNRR